MMNLIQGIMYAVAGLSLICWANSLSLRYNAWTTSLRERHPKFNAPPTTQARARNTKIMTLLFRIFGAFLIVLSIPMLLTIVRN